MVSSVIAQGDLSQPQHISFEVEPRFGGPGNGRDVLDPGMEEGLGLLTHGKELRLRELSRPSWGPCLSTNEPLKSNPSLAESSLMCSETNPGRAEEH